ncbi:MAG TPA: hypothetical protein VFT71_00135 [Candidatus Nitrosocosmicus sp.]|nr:hypothetical protein [Candidatus Nitrosocosmicus sp.]
MSSNFTNYPSECDCTDEVHDDKNQQNKHKHVNGECVHEMGPNIHSSTKQ